MINKPLIWILDDDQQVIESLQWLLESVGLDVRAFLHTEDFLATYLATRHSLHERPGCLLLDVRMPGKSGLEIQAELQQQQTHLPVIVMTGHGDVSMAVQAMKNGAFDFFEKPFNDQQLLDCINKALQQHQQLLLQHQTQSILQQRYACLTQRETQIFCLLASGLAGKQVADQLNISTKTIDVHRHNIMQKMQLHSFAELIHAAYELNLIAPNPLKKNL